MGLHSWLVQAEDSHEACHEGWQEGDLWQDGDGEGEAGEKDGQGLPVGCPEEEHLSRERDLARAREPVSLASAASRGRSAEDAKPGVRERHYEGTCIPGG